MEEAELVHDDEVFTCPICDANFWSTVEVVEHVELHSDADSSYDRNFTFAFSESLPESDADFAYALQLQELENGNGPSTIDEQRQFKELQREYGMDERGGFVEQAKEAIARAHQSNRIDLGTALSQRTSLSILSATGFEEPDHCVSGLLNNIMRLSSSSNDVAEAHFCSGVDHYGSSYGDRGWGCGYRNAQMLLSSLAHNQELRQTLFGTTCRMPAIPKLQSLIEEAWAQGFDELGAMQLNGKLRDTRKWIGTTEVMAFLHRFGLRVEIFDFHRSTGPSNTHPLLFERVWDHFSSNSAFKPALYLQHQGHSRTIVGVERLKKGGTRLLIFDPSHAKERIEALKRSTAPRSLLALRRLPKDLTKEKYQLLFVKTGLMDADTKEVYDGDYMYKCK